MNNIGSILIYKLKGLDQIERDNLCRRLLGRTVKTHHGKYIHHVKGILDNIPHIRIGKGIIIVEKKNRKKILDFLKENDVQDVFVRDIFLTKEDIGGMKK